MVTEPASPRAATKRVFHGVKRRLQLASYELKSHHRYAFDEVTRIINQIGS